MKFKVGDWVELNNGWIVGPLVNSFGELSIEETPPMKMSLFWKENGKVVLLGKRYPNGEHPLAIKSVYKKGI